MSTKKILDSVFEGHNLTTAVWNDKIVWLSSEISLALGYKKPWRISDAIRREWKEEFSEEQDFKIVSSDEIETRDFAVSNRARRVMLLTEQGVDLVILKSRRKAGVRLRRHLSSVVLPQFRRGMIEERPVAELEARYRQEISALKDKLIERDEQVICFAEKLMESQSKLADANYTLGALGEAKAAVRHSAKLAGQSLQACKRTKKLRDVN